MVRPELGMDGISEGATSVSKTSDLVLEGRCRGNCDGTFLWTIERVDEDGTTIQLTPDELKLAAKGTLPSLNPSICSSRVYRFVSFNRFR